jgi:acyl carrier protein
MTMADVDAKQVYSRIVELIGEFNKKNLPVLPTTTFATDLAFDSLTVMDLVAAMEDEWDIIIPLNLLPDLETVQQVADAVTRIVSEK